MNKRLKTDYILIGSNCNNVRGVPGEGKTRETGGERTNEGIPTSRVGPGKMRGTLADL